MKAFSFQNDRCLNCEAELPEETTSLFCINCEPIFPVQRRPSAKSTRFNEEEELRSAPAMKIGDLAEGEVGYIMHGAVYTERETGDIKVFGNSTLSFERTELFIVRVTREEDLILVDFRCLNNKPFRKKGFRNGSFDAQIANF